MAGGALADSRKGRNGWHGIVGLLRQSIYGRLAGYEDVNDVDRLGRDPAMRWIVGDKAVERGGASTSQMGRLETGLLANDDNLAALFGRLMSADADTRPIGAGHRMGPWISVFPQRIDKFVDQMGMRTAVSAPLKERAVFRIVNLLGECELTDAFG